MLEKHLQTPVTIKRLRDGVAGPHIDEFAVWMHSKGFKPVVLELRLRSLAALTDWMANHRYSLSELITAIEACKRELEKGRKLGSRALMLIQLLRPQNSSHFCKRKVFLKNQLRN